jgi:hypothetical protein
MLAENGDQRPGEWHRGRRRLGLDVIELQQAAYPVERLADRHPAAD